MKQQERQQQDIPVVQLDFADQMFGWFLFATYSHLDH